ncbi:hypothetical protein GF386_05070 [Candidatus Pacearchaeota archaeon]|nr:hypothetical protein [Candidatus Pacearchaeota archaeon]MBD3283482.1 hypothetical protein [Candidatus Pacearchaeota archaeon]
MSRNQRIRIREAENKSSLPDRLRNMRLMGFYHGNLYLGAESTGVISDTFIFGYSIPDNFITGMVRLERGAWPSSWTQKDNLLFVGTRFGIITAVDMDDCDEVGRLNNMGNSIDAIAVNGAVYFGVNGKGLFKSDTGLTSPSCIGKGHVVSALALDKDRLFAFYFSNGNDPFLDEGPAGGLVEVLDSNLSVQSERDGTPYAVTQAVTTEQGLRFSTRNTTNASIPFGTGELYSLNQSDLSDEFLLEFPAAVNVLRELRQGILLAGLRDGQVYEVKGNERRLINSQEHGVAGLASEDDIIYIGSPVGEISKVGDW